ncbi:MAG: metal-dependent hydrolase [Pyrinomonadaceae bacterium]
MPLPIAHGCVGAAIVALIHPKIKRIVSFPLLFGGFMANAADLDFILSYSTGDKSWHRGFTHSVLFSFFIAAIFLVWFKKERLREALAYSLAYFSHLVLDFSTSDHGGPELFWFFSERRFSVGVVSFSVAPSKLPLSEILYAAMWETAVFGTLFFAVYFMMRRYYSDGFSSAD